MSVNLYKPSNLQIWYKLPIDGEWRIKAVTVEKRTYPVISQLITALWDELDKEAYMPQHPEITIIDPDYANSGQSVELMVYRPFDSIWVNRDFVCMGGEK